MKTYVHIMTWAQMFIAVFSLRPKLERSKKSISRWIDNQVWVYLHSGILLINQKECTSGLHENVLKSQRRYAEHKNPDTNM